MLGAPAATMAAAVEMAVPAAPAADPVA